MRFETRTFKMTVSGRIPMTSDRQPISRNPSRRCWIPSPGWVFVCALTVILAPCTCVAWRVHRQVERLQYCEQIGAHFQTKPAEPIVLHDLVEEKLGGENAAGFTEFTAIRLRRGRNDR